MPVGRLLEGMGRAHDCVAVVGPDLAGCAAVVWRGWAGELISRWLFRRIFSASLAVGTGVLWGSEGWGAPGLVCPECVSNIQKKCICAVRRAHVSMNMIGHNKAKLIALGQ